MNDLKLIKKHYGEKMMHLCREEFPSLLETEGLLWSIITKKFPYSRHIADDIIKKNAQEEFKNIIYSCIDVENSNKIIINKTPQELLDEVGYTLYECHSDEDIQQFRKYYHKTESDYKNQYITKYNYPSWIGEEICTFNGGRLERAHVFFAVKKNVDEIKRENFNKPERQDEYGTSVISIQFSKDSSNTLSIKNRYNHTVNQPDATFSNNLDNIIPGLTEAFNKTYGLNINSSKTNYEIPGYVLASDGKYYPYNYEINNIYYCPDNIIIDNFKVKKFDKSKYIVLDHFIIDLVNKTITKYDDSEKDDTFLDSIPEINNIRVEVDKTSKNKIITINNDIIIEINSRGQIEKYENKHIKRTNENFLFYNNSLKEINIPNVENIDDGFLYNNTKLESINLPLVKAIGHSFLQENKILKEINIPNVEKIDNSFLYYNEELKEINIPKVKIIGTHFLSSNNKIENLDLPECEKLGYPYGYILYNNKVLKRANLPKITTIYKGTFEHNEDLEYLNIPNVTMIGDEILVDNKRLKELNSPKVTYIGNSFLQHNTDLEKINITNVEKIDDNVLSDNNKIKTISLPKVKSIGYAFLRKDEVLNSIDLPLVETISESFLERNKELTSINLPNVQKVGMGFLSRNHKLSSIYVPNLIEIGDCFLLENTELEYIDLPNTEVIYSNFLSDNNKIKELNLPKVKEIGINFLNKNQRLTTIKLPEVNIIDEGFLENNNHLERIEIGNIDEASYKNLSEYIKELLNSKTK